MAKKNVVFKVDVCNVRITGLKKTWADVPGIRIQAYRGVGKALCIGPEIPFTSLFDAVALLSAVSSVVYKVIWSCYKLANRR